MKKCIRCGKVKSIDCYRKYSRAKDGRQGVCKECKKISDRVWREKHAYKLEKTWKQYYEDNKEVIKKRASVWEDNNKAYVRERKRKYRKKNIKRIKAKGREYGKANRDRLNRYFIEYRKKRLKNDPEFQASISMQRILHRVIRQTTTMKDAKTHKLLGYTAKDLKEHIESKFLPGMSWKNRGDWHIDHIKPVSAFIDEGTTDPAIINALDNLQPLWAEDNMKKGANYIEA